MAKSTYLPTYPTLQLSYRELRYLKEVLENYRFYQNSGNDAYGMGWGSSCLCHYDALHREIDMQLSTKRNFLLGKKRHLVVIVS